MSPIVLTPRRLRLRHLAPGECLELRDQVQRVEAGQIEVLEADLGGEPGPVEIEELCHQGGDLVEDCLLVHGLYPALVSLWSATNPARLLTDANISRFLASSAVVFTP